MNDFEQQRRLQDRRKISEMLDRHVEESNRLLEEIRMKKEAEMNAANERILCGCGHRYRASGRERHLKTKYHKKMIDSESSL
jgi:hypothetical protein